MRLFICVVSIFAVSSTFAQSFYKSSSKPEFKSLMEKGLYFLPTGDALRDQDFISALNENWDITEVTVYDPKDESMELTGDEIFLIEADFIDDGGSVLGLLPFKTLQSEGISKYDMIGFIATNGYDQKEDSITKLQYLNLSISGLNDVVQTIKDNEISKKGAGLYISIYNAILPKSNVLKDKTLLIVGKTDEYVSTSALLDAGIKVKKVSISEYESLKEDGELKEYCLFYFAYNAFTEISIYNLANNELIYSRHFANGKAKFSGRDISAMKKSWD